MATGVTISYFLFSEAFFPPVAFSLDDKLMGVMREAVEGRVGEDGVVEESRPFIDAPVAGDDR